jgi:hypothetical protein
MDIQQQTSGRLRRFFLRAGSFRWDRCRALNSAYCAMLEDIRDPQRLVDQAELQPAKSDIRRAIAELRTYTDSQLSDVGIIRADIERVVRKGRFQVERPRSAA